MRGRPTCAARPTRSTTAASYRSRRGSASMSNPKGFLKALIAAVVALCLVPAAIAQQSNAFVVPYTGTLKKVNDSGVLRIGHRENSPPFAFLDKRGKPIGYALDLCAVVVEEIVSELGKDIRVDYQPVTPENRFDLLNSGAIDLEC